MTNDGNEILNYSQNDYYFFFFSRFINDSIRTEVMSGFKGAIYEIILPLDVVVVHYIYTKTNRLPASGEQSVRSGRGPTVLKGGT